MGYKVAVVGATGNVGREMLNILAEREFPADEVVALASRRSHGRRGLLRRHARSRCKALEHFDFSDVDICLMSAGGAVSKEWSPKIAAAGCVVIDNSSAWRYDPDVPLIVPEVNADAVAGFTQEEHHRQPELLDRAARGGAEAAARQGDDQARGGRDLPVGLRRRQGRAWTSCSRRPRRVYVTDQELEPKKFPKRIAFNVIPHIDVFMEDGYTKEEWKMVVETKKILDPKIKLTATCVRVPVFVGHSEAVNIEFEKPITRRRGARHPARGAGLPRHRQARARRLRHAVSRRPARTRPTSAASARTRRSRTAWRMWVRLRQPAQGRGAQRRADRRVPDQPQADQREEEGGVTPRCRRVGKGAKRRAHHLSTIAIEVVGTARCAFAHPTNSSARCARSLNSFAALSSTNSDPSATPK